MVKGIYLVMVFQKTLNPIYYMLKYFKEDIM